MMAFVIGAQGKGDYNGVLKANNFDVHCSYVTANAVAAYTKIGTLQELERLISVLGHGVVIEPLDEAGSKFMFPVKFSKKKQASAYLITVYDDYLED